MISLAATLSSNTPFMISLESKTKEDAVRELVGHFFEQEPPDHRRSASEEEVWGEVIKRENTLSTGIGQGLAFPHARMEGWGGLSVIVGVSREGIDFASVDNSPVHVVFLMISSVDEPYVILQTMSAVLRNLKERINIDQISKGTVTFQDLGRIFEKVQVNPLERILVSHIASPVDFKVTMNTSLKELSRLIYETRTDILPVVDENNVFCGEVSCQDVFQIGMPDFFNQLKTISFIKYLDPFDKLFSLKDDLRVADICRRDQPVLKNQDTLMEVIFEMTVKKRSKLFVVNDDGTLAGIVDKFTIIDKILYY